MSRDNAYLRDLIGPPGEWAERAACLTADPEIFFPERGGCVEPAKAICAGCDVVEECLEYALENREQFGVWGGMSPRERKTLRRKGWAA